ncbi:G2/mitotic-specific cyclin S13-6-like isoform X1 [Trifolium pratense]|uniref:G2/mitotic-specific cyclin S13-6-like isoform X1 n=1 Tax=Trifolium pratense TaxID=57577 RepID=UPI001E69496F|nr:G2/mitotic-specific cyclin S13-6-like isoform X1 [Trifolium pratense]
MASRIVPQQQHKGEGRNRRALLDIRNVVTLKGVEVKPNSPVTRSFCEQLLANAETSLCQWRFDPLLHYSLHFRDLVWRTLLLFFLYS